MLSADIGLWRSVRREIKSLTSRPTYLFTMIIVPIGCAIFFMSLLGKGLPLKVPTAVVDLDHSSMSRSLTQSLNAMELVDIQQNLGSYHEALTKVREGEIFGFFMIPAHFESDAIAGRTPTLGYYTNMTYFIPGTLSFKGFKTIAVTTAGSVVKTTLVSTGADPDQVTPLLQPMVADIHPIGNPWSNYSIYLSPSFSFATIALMIMLVTVFSITGEIKHGTSVEWLETAKGRISVALMGKLIPHAIIFCITCIAIEALMFGFQHFPLHGSAWVMITAMILFVVASQAMGVFFSSIVPNPRMALSLASLIGILTFSFAGFSFPVQSMYGPIAAFSYCVPSRYMFLIYINEALNGFALYYSRWHFIALLLFPVIGSTLILRLKKACLDPIYVP